MPVTLLPLTELITNVPETSGLPATVESMPHRDGDGKLNSMF
ncbi:hypothetical protein ACP2W0_17745 [Pseudobacillus badius]